MRSHPGDRNCYQLVFLYFLRQGVFRARRGKDRGNRPLRIPHDLCSPDFVHIFDKDSPGVRVAVEAFSIDSEPNLVYNCPTAGVPSRSTRIPNGWITRTETLRIVNSITPFLTTVHS